MNSYWLLFSQVGQSLPVLLTCAVLTILLTILVCALGFPRERPWSQGGVKAFLNFDRLVIASVLKFLYVLLSVGLVVFLIGGLVHFCASAASTGLAAYMDAGQWATLVLVAIVALVVLEIAVRLLFELLMLSVKLVENVIAIRRHLDEDAELRACGSTGGEPGAGIPDAAGAAGAGASAAGQGWYEPAGHEGAYDGGWAQQAGYDAPASRTAAYPPEPVAVARAQAGETPTAWQGQASYQGQDPYQGQASYQEQGAYHEQDAYAAYGQDEGAYDPYAGDYDGAQDGYGGAYEGAYDEGVADEPQPTPTTVMAPSAGSTTALPASGAHASPAEGESWDCVCGARGNVGNFCGHCGSPRPKGGRS